MVIDIGDGVIKNVLFGARKHPGERELVDKAEKDFGKNWSPGQDFNHGRTGS